MVAKFPVVRKFRTVFLHNQVPENDENMDLSIGLSYLFKLWSTLTRGLSAQMSNFIWEILKSQVFTNFCKLTTSYLTRTLYLQWDRNLRGSRSMDDLWFCFKVVWIYASDNISETTVQISAKFYLSHLWPNITKACSKCFFPGDKLLGTAHVE